mmetsp:Transcript_85306/g.104615  ORF Transcript_85306/g.104615 Transcript_85306/m.104615 type:complete len:260 (-) Transcript_85306:98-877(-)
MAKEKTKTLISSIAYDSYHSYEFNDKFDEDRFTYKWKKPKKEGISSKEADILTQVNAIKETIIKECGNKVYDDIVKRHKKALKPKILKKINKKSKSRHLSKTVYAKPLKDADDNDDELLGYEIKLDVNYDEEMKNKDEFVKKVKQELSNHLDVDPQLMIIDNFTKGSLGFWLKIKVFALSIGRSLWQSGPRRHLQPNVDFEVGGPILVTYKDTRYPCIVKAYIACESDSKMKVHYTQDPFWFRNTEWIYTNSDRLVSMR